MGFLARVRWVESVRAIVLLEGAFLVGESVLCADVRLEALGFTLGFPLVWA